MMEVKQSAPVDLNDLLATVKSTDDVTDRGVNDVVMTDLTDEVRPADLNCDDIMKTDNIGETPNNGLVKNGDEPLSSIIDLDSTAGAINTTPVSAELEDALLAEDDALLPKLTDVKVNSIAASESVAVDDLLADKAETSNSTTSSNNVRDPGDDLDTLLSKINDIVEDCLDEENLAAAEEKAKNEAQVGGGDKEPQVESMDESVILLDDTATDESCLDVDKTLPRELENVETAKPTAEDNDCEAAENKETNEDIAEDENKKEDDGVVPTDDKDSSKEETNNKEKEVENPDSEGIISEDVLPPTNASDETPAITTATEETSSEEKISADKQQNEDDKILDEENTNDLEKMLVDEDETVDSTKENELLDAKNDEDTVLTDGDKTEDLLLSEDEKDMNTQNSKEENVVESETKNLNEVEEHKKSEETEQPKEEENNSKPQQSDDTKETENELEEEKTELSQKSEAKESPKDMDGPPEIEDSDDEIVFYVDKPPEKVKETASEAKEADAKLSTTTATEEKSYTENKVAEKVTEDNDIVILDDDDDMQADKKETDSSPKKSVCEEKSVDTNKNNDVSSSKTTEESEETKKDTERKHSTIDMDNSDNARDDFVVGTDKTFKKPEDTEDNSNCSSSSNLLLEAKQSENTGDEPTPEENDNEEDDDDGDVELIETESKEAGENSSEKGDESSEAVPPAKRPRLSEDSELSCKTDDNSKSRRASECLEKKPESESNASNILSTSLKRPHDVIELEMDNDKSNDSKSSVTETSTKKPRTEGIEDKTNIEKGEEVLKKTDEPPVIKTDESTDVDQKQEVKKDILKVEPSDEPIRLYPAPKLKHLGSDDNVSLGFLKKFRKSFDKMTKQDLEELVLQKVVEAIIHRSEFAEMRELIEKQEKLITSHRAKISELSKQFRDLEMVHNRVVKDIEQRNAQFIMPVKITRAVGLQVYIPNKKTLMEANATAAAASGAGTSNIPAVSPQRAATNPSHSNLTSPQRSQFNSPQSAAASEALRTTPNTSVNSANTTAPPRRGCAQKVTPIRPVPGASNPSPVSSVPQTSNSSTQVYRNNLNQNQVAQPRILNKNAAASPMGGSTIQAANMNSSAMQRQRYLQQAKAANQDVAQRLTSQQQQQSARPPVGNMHNNQRVVQQPQKVPNNSSSSIQRRPDPSPSAVTNNATSLDNYMNTLTQLTGGNTAVSITPAKPKEKAVIDLTDEDEIPSAPQQQMISPQQTNPAQRRSLPAQTNNTNVSQQQQYGGRTAPPLARIPPSQILIFTFFVHDFAGQKNNSFTSTINTPPGTSITRINVGPNTQVAQRVKYSHPAPLPATPPQAFNPNWKLPPPRPTIRISNLDNGIVISWTMEEAMDRHAECVSYQIYAYQETSGPPMADSWRHVGDVKAMLLPMAVTLTQFQEGQRYFFAVRAVDCHQRYGPFSLPKTWS
ncbi:activating transcription factor 7-interacting protein 1 [Musca vetustissima]|uniref:activating transcription factor 7-interacting protein 1 n=1 Tax=Musca vetustissima TaxID=27455 RepID=UPI002AB7C269|nr:activating transcription factor 7-interacting protein 1 [Musca vetustissima]